MLIVVGISYYCYAFRAIAILDIVYFIDYMPSNCNITDCRRRQLSHLMHLTVLEDRTLNTLGLSYIYSPFNCSFAN